jgi:hypothetical protein
LASLLTFLGSVPFGPRNFRAWRLRRLAATIGALDPDRHKAQRTVLENRRYRLADLVAAAYQVRTPWRRYVSAAAAFGFSVGWSYYLWCSFEQVRVFETITLLSFSTFALLMSYRWTVPYLRYIHAERSRFIAQGCPERFATTRTPDAIRDINYRRRQQRSLQAAARGRERSRSNWRVRRAGIARWLRRF